MSLHRIRLTYKVPAFRGAIVEYKPEKEGHLSKRGRITSAKGDYLRIWFDGDRCTYPAPFHPQWNIKYL